MKFKNKLKRKIKKTLNKIFTEKRKDILVFSLLALAIAYIGYLGQIPVYASQNITVTATAPKKTLPTATTTIEKPKTELKKAETPKITIKAKGSVADRLNNPGNLMYAGQKGATEGDYGFAKFKTIEDGWRALLRQVRVDQNRDYTIEQFVNKYAPPVANDTEKYITIVSNNLKLNKLTNISNIDTHELAEEVMNVECGGYVE